VFDVQPFASTSDEIADFEVGVDAIALNRFVFGGLPAGALPETAFAEASPPRTRPTASCTTPRAAACSTTPTGRAPAAPSASPTSTRAST
jgi:hypothetical protein